MDLYQSIKIVRDESVTKYKINGINDVVNLPHIQDIKNKLQEHLIVITLNTKNEVNGVTLVGIGTMRNIYLNTSDIIRCAIISGSEKVIIAHNHPTGNSEPSREDILFTNRINTALNIAGVKLLDHVIVGEGYSSMLELGHIKEKQDLKILNNRIIEKLQAENMQLMIKVEQLKRKLQKEDELKIQFIHKKPPANERKAGLYYFDLRDSEDTKGFTIERSVLANNIGSLVANQDILKYCSILTNKELSALNYKEVQDLYVEEEMEM